MSNEHESRLAAGLRKASHQIGFIGLLSIVFVGCALLVQASSSMPTQYTWTRPLKLLESMAKSRNFPTMVAFVWILGVLARVRRARKNAAGRRSFLEVGRQGLQSLDRPRIARMVVGSAVLVTGAAVAGLRYHLLDIVALGILGAGVGWMRPSPRRIARSLGELGFVLVTFTLVSYGFTIFKAALFIDTVPNDDIVLMLETLVFGEPPHKMVARWASMHPQLVIALDEIYYHIFQHMALVSVFLVAAALPKERIEYLGSLALCYVIGGLSYHLFPAVGPAFADPESFAFLRQLPLLTNYFQAFLLANTEAVAQGNAEFLSSYDYIACVPSLHMAHEFVMLYYARHSRVFFALSCVFTGFTLVAIVVLGWHYPVDAIAGLMVTVLAVTFARKARNQLFPAVIMPPDDLQDEVAEDDQSRPN